MQLTQFSDYALRLSLYAMAHRDRLVSADEVSRAYGISRHHLVKVVQKLVELGVLESARGRGGGVRLRRPPEEVNVGALVRRTEPTLDLVECFDMATNTCPIAAACGLKGALLRARQAFFKVLDGYTLADFAPRAQELIPLWEVKLRRAAGEEAAG